MGRPIGNLAHGVNLTDRHLQGIGKVAVRWAELEDTIKEIVGDLANIRHTSALAVTAHINERMLTHIAMSRVDLLVTGPEKKLAEDIKKHLNYIIETVYPKRNALVHSIFGHGGTRNRRKQTSIFPVTSRGKLKLGPRKYYSSQDIFAIAQEIYDANLKLWEFSTKLRELIPTWRHIQKS